MKAVKIVAEDSQDSFKTYHYPRADTKKDNFPGTKRSKSLEKMPGRSPGTFDGKWGSAGLAGR